MFINIINCRLFLHISDFDNLVMEVGVILFYTLNSDLVFIALKPTFKFQISTSRMFQKTFTPCPAFRSRIIIRTPSVE
jgi:hypothetical protein